MIWFVILLVILAVGSLLWSIHDTLKEAERMVEEEKLENNGKEQHNTRTGGKTD